MKNTSIIIPLKEGSEKTKFNSFYSDTLKVYGENFGINPPENIWPKNEKRFSSNQFQRVNREEFWLFRKLVWNTKFVILAILIPITWFLVQATNKYSFTPLIFLAIIGLIIFLVYRTSKNNENNNRNDGKIGRAHV